MKRPLVVCAAVMTMIFMVVVPGLSQDQDQGVVPQRVKHACKADIKEFCQGIKPGGGRIWACLKSNEDRLSRDCKDHIAQARERVKEFRQACRADMDKFCKGIVPGEGRIAACLKNHERELSETCRSIFQK